MKISMEELEKQLQNNSLQSLYFFYGPETFLLESVVKKIKKQFSELVPGINEIIIDETNYTKLIAEIETPSFGYERKLILVKQSGLLKKEGKRKNADLEVYRKLIQEYLVDHMEEIRITITLVFIEEETEKSELMQLIEKQGIVCQFDIQKPAIIAKRINSICQGYGVSIESAVLSYFIETCGTNMQELINEIRKLIEYAGKGGTITKKEIDQLATKQIDAVIFDLTDQLGKKQIKQALETLQNLIYQKEPMQRILITLYNHFKKLYLVQLAQKENRDIVQALDLKPNQMFLASKYKMQANYFLENELKTLLKEWIKLDYSYKVGQIDLAIGLETILCRYCS